MASNGALLMPNSDLDKGDSVKRALEVYSQWSRQVAPYVQAALAGKVQVPPQTMSAEVWLTLALFWERTNKTLEGLIRDADVVGHSLPSAEEVAWTLVKLRERGWLSTEGALFGLTTGGIHTIESVVEKGSLRERYHRLTEWISTHPPKGVD
jgi:hypothetical protein